VKGVGALAGPLVDAGSSDEGSAGDDDDDDDAEDYADEEDEEGEGEGDGDEDGSVGDDGDDTLGPLRGQEDDDDDEDDDKDDDVVVVRDEKPAAPPADDSEFELLLAAALQESVESRRVATRVSADNMAIPMAALKAQASRASAHQSAAFVPAMMGGGGDGSGAPVTGKVFTVLRRRAKGVGAGKVETRSLVVPDSVPLSRVSAKAVVRAKRGRRPCASVCGPGACLCVRAPRVCWCFCWYLCVVPAFSHVGVAVPDRRPPKRKPPS
jgi:hypothetical protein